MTYPHNNQSRWEFLDGLRGLAVLMVISVHTISVLGVERRGLAKIFYGGERGVQLFFLVSAFTIYLLETLRMNAEKKLWVNFFIRRAFRILPLWWLMCLLYFLFLGHYEWNNFLATALMYGGFFRYNQNYELIISGGWSIFIEMCFYSAFPFIFFITRKGIRHTVLTTLFFIILSVCWKKYGVVMGIPDTGKRYVFFHPITHFYCFTFGVFLAQIYQSSWKLPHVLQGSRVGIFVAILCLSTLGLHYYLAVLGLVLFMLFSFSGNVMINRIVHMKGLMKLGVCCYGIYFFHFIVLRFFQNYVLDFVELPKWVEFSLLFPLVVGLSFLIALPVYKYFELPFIRLGRSIVLRNEGRAT